MIGSGALLILSAFTAPDPQLISVTAIIFMVALLVDLFITLVGEFSIPHASEVAAKAAHEISHGHYKKHFWWGSIGLGHIVPLLLMGTAVFFISSPILGVLAGLAAGVGLYLYEYAFVMAPQEIPNS